MEKIMQIIDLELSGLKDLKNQLGSSIKDVVKLLKNTTGNILITGMGTSGTVARRMAHLMGCVGASAYFVHPADHQHGASGSISRDDIIIVFSKGGESEEINSFLEITRKKGCKIVAITGSEKSTMSTLVDQQIVFSISEETEPFGMIATTSSLAASLVVDIICILLLHESDYSEEEFGKTHPGGMVGRKVKENKGV